MAPRRYERVKIASPEFLAAKAAKEMAAAAKAAEEAAIPLHDVNDWGISCDSAAVEEVTVGAHGRGGGGSGVEADQKQKLGEGIVYSMAGRGELIPIMESALVSNVAFHTFDWEHDAGFKP
jgi:hypothetical protein